MIRRRFGVEFFQQGANAATAAVRGVDQALRGAAGAHGQVEDAARRQRTATDQAAAGQKGLEGATKRTTDSTRSFTDGNARATASLTELHSGLQLARQAARAAGIALAAIKAPTDLATSFEFEVAKIRTLGAQLPADLEAQLLELAARVPQTAGDITKAAYDAISAGIDPGQVAGFLDAASKVAVAGSASMTEAVGALSAATNAYKDSGLTAAQAADQLFGAVRKGVTTFDQLAANQGKSVAVAAQLGVSFAELNAAVAQLTQVGVPTSEAYTRVNATLKALGKELGLGFVQANGLVGSLEELQRRGLTTADAIAKMTNRQEAQQGLMVLLKGGMAGYRSTLEGVTDAVGSAGQAFTVMSDTTQGQLDKLKASVDTSLTEIGRRALPAVRLAVEDLSAAVSGPEGQELMAGLASIVKLLVTMGGAAAQAAAGLARLAGSMTLPVDRVAQELRVLTGQGSAVDEAVVNMGALSDVFTNMRGIRFAGQIQNEVNALAAGVTPKIDALTKKAGTLWATLSGQTPTATRKPPKGGRGGRGRQQRLDVEADQALALMELEYQAAEAELNGARTTRGEAGDEPGGPLQIAQSYEALGVAIGHAMDMGVDGVGRFGDALREHDLAAQAIEAHSQFAAFGAALAETLLANTLNALMFGNSVQQAIGGALKMASVEAGLGAMRATAKAFEAAGTPFMQWAVGPLMASAGKWAALSAVTGVAGVAIGGGGGGGGSARGGGGAPSSGRPAPSAVGTSSGGGGGSTYIINNSFEGRTYATQAQIGADIEQATRARGQQRGGGQVSRYAQQSGRS